MVLGPLLAYIAYEWSIFDGSMPRSPLRAAWEAYTGKGVIASSMMPINCSGANSTNRDWTISTLSALSLNRSSDRISNWVIKANEGWAIEESALYGIDQSALILQGPKTVFGGYQSGVKSDPTNPSIFYTADQALGLVYRVDRTKKTLERIAGVQRPSWHIWAKLLVNFLPLDWGDGGAALSASLDGPRAPTAHPRTGDIYIPEHGAMVGGHKVRKLDPRTGILTTVFGADGPGIGGAGCGGDGGQAADAFLSVTSCVVPDPSDDNILHLCDLGNHAIRMVDLRTGIITTSVGTLCSYGSTGDGGPATQATIGMPGGIDFDKDSGDMYVADYLFHVVRKVDRKTGIISTFAGQAGVAGLSGDGGLAAEALLMHPGTLMVHPKTKDVFVVNEPPANVIRHISHRTGIITTIAGVPCWHGFNGFQGPATEVALAFPNGLAYDYLTGGVLVSDGQNGAVRLLTPVWRS